MPVRSRALHRLALLAPALLLTASAVGQTQEEVLTNDTILAMTRAGLPSTVVVAKILQSRTLFDVSAPALVQLAKGGVAESVITAMLEATSSPAVRALQVGPQSASPTDSLALIEETPAGERLVPLEPAFYNDRLSTGLFNFSVHIVLPGTSARVRTENRRPAFELRMSSGGKPTHYVLSRLEGSDEGSGRRVDLESGEAFDVETLGPGKFRLRPRRELKRGEWCLYTRGVDAPERPLQAWTPLETSGTQRLQIYDFGVDQPPGRKRAK